MTEEIRELRSKLADKSKRETFGLQKECGAQAAKVFSESGFNDDHPHETDASRRQRRTKPQPTRT